jgi:hypothetical protein
MRLGVTYIASFLPHHIEHDLNELASIGCDDVLFAIQENHLDTLQGAVKFGPAIAKKCGLRPQAVIWGFLNTFGGGRMSGIMLKDTSIWRVDREGKAVPMACLSNPAVMQHLSRAVDTLRDAGFECFFIDEPTPQQCYCTHCRQTFSNWFGGDLLAADQELYQQFQRRLVVDYVDRGCKTVKAIDPKLETICCLMPCDKDCAEAAAQVAALDMLGTDPYWLLPFMKLTLQDALDDTKSLHALCRGHGKRSQVWLNCWGIPEGVEEDIYRGGLQLAAVGCDSMFTWSYRGGLGTSEQCARADVAWQQLTRLYRELSGRSK